MRTITQIAMAVALIPALLGCGSMLTSNEPPERTYWLEPTAADGTSGVPVTLHMTLVPGLNSEHIWILQPHRRLNYYAGAAWAERLDMVLRSVIERSLNVETNAPGAVNLDVVIERFFAVESSPGVTPTVELQARIRRSDWQGAACIFTTDRQPATARLRDIVAAHQWVLDDLIRQLRATAQAPASDEPGTGLTCPRYNREDSR